VTKIVSFSASMVLLTGVAGASVPTCWSGGFPALGVGLVRRVLHRSRERKATPQKHSSCEQVVLHRHGNRILFKSTWLKFLVA
jgi:hypothetical protein